MRAHAGMMEISLRSLSQLFNSMDPSPFNERDLDQHAEQFLVSWAQEIPASSPLELLVHLPAAEATPQAERCIREGLEHYFSERARLTRAQLQQLLRQGRTSLLIGLAFLFACLTLGSLYRDTATGSLGHLVYEGLIIVGWVAMWRPLEIYLYDWWPLWQQIALFRRLQRMPVQLRAAGDDPFSRDSAASPAARRPGPRDGAGLTRTPAP
ncbi:MAG TPA: hypothetical protein VLI06_12845 [Solimonas sp.]|nr:hypothetical protein [Solimonas sp.]